MSTKVELPKIKIPTPLSTLRQVDRLVAAGKWTQGGYRKRSKDGTEQFCLVGCVNHVLGVHHDLPYDGVVTWDDLDLDLSFVDDLDGKARDRLQARVAHLDNLRDAVFDALLDCANEQTDASRQAFRARLLASVAEECAEELRDGRMTEGQIAAEVEDRVAETFGFQENDYCDLESWNDEDANNPESVRAATKCAMKRVGKVSSK